MPNAPLALKYRSYAKINLYLDVLRKRRDGYHDIETIFQTVGLYDELTFHEHRGRIDVSCNRDDLDTGEGNLVFRAAALLRKRAGLDCGARIVLDKRIPISAGLAGGSGNAAATLIALNVLWDLRWPLERLRGLALELGSDAPYCTLGGAAIGTRRGEELLPLDGVPRAWFVLVHPLIAVSASHAYNSPKLECHPQTTFAGRSRALRDAIAALRRGDFPALVSNRLEAPVFAEYPQLEVLKRRLREAGCIAAAMSGSGSTLFGVCESAPAAARAADALQGLRTSVVPSVPCGVERIE